MAGPLVFWPNRKSKLGSQKSAKTPRSFGRVFVTKPPIAASPMRDLAPFAKPHDEDLEIFRETVSKMIIALGDSDELKKQVRKGASDKEMCLLAARLCVDIIEKKKIETDEHLTTLTKLRDSVEADKRAEREAHEAAREALINELRQLKKEIDPDEIKLRIMYEAEERSAAIAKELAEAKTLIAERDSEIAELKRSKKRLREALDRLKDET